MSSKPLVVSKKQGAVCLIGINRPEVRNCVDAPTADALVAAFQAFEADESLSVAVLYGVDGHFSAGGDLAAVGTEAQNKFDRFREGPLGPTRMLLRKPVIAAVAGHAVAGGLELAIWADLRVVEETATFGVFCRRFGVPLLDGGTVRLPRLIGASRAMDMILTGRAVSAKEAYDWGLANRLVAPGQAVEAAVTLASQLAAFPQATLRADRHSAMTQWSFPLERALQLEFKSGLPAMFSEGAAGARRFVEGEGRHGAFKASE